LDQENVWEVADTVKAYVQ